MIRIMQNKYWEPFLFIIWALGMLGTIIYFCYEEQSWAHGLVRLSVSLFTIASLLGYCYIRCLKNEYKKSETKTEEKLDDISRQIADIRSITSNNSEMYFLQNLAASIGDKGSLWTDKQIERFLQCMEFISKNEKQNSNVEAEEQTSNNGN